ncbi:MAG: hypothetical protein ACJA2Y_001171 [Cycloclasticus pugetii]|jgi:hypothetical protein|uniref:Uncharacterized protein n=2 Tax=Cycloclasticus TaxID=34067 RepID=A0AB33Z4L1_9GAMM|nr:MULTISPECIES: hypothetical protein [Cycloclasticus]ATI03687.1 hypothetical protein CPC19_09490 [Cycloclasticus sp. PY97N]EPD14177.1 hypothetical protein L196_01730 [Cycloclasticus pugetii]PHR52236.1 MAG: hypothetical protein COA48_02205 [Cycloclasticus sp.]SHI98034.1 hypothetical protein SAMN05519226_1244 [Cycloclasticus pugetii]
MGQQDLKQESRCWGVFDLTPNTRLQFNCGDLLLDIASGEKDWLMQYELKTSDTVHNPCIQLMGTGEEGWSLANKQRIVSNNMPQKLSLTPVMSDRAIVCRATTTVVLLPKEQISLYVAVPLWLQLSIRGGEKPLLDVSTERISDTWFGLNSREGVMSYALRMSEQLDIQPSTNHGMRVTIEIRIKNESNEQLNLDKVSVPAPHLALYVDEVGHFWTRRITMVREQDEQATLTIDKVMSTGLAHQNLTLVSAARDDLGQHKITKALSALFG